MTDPRQRNQPALTTSTGLIWLVMGGLLSAISLVVLAVLGSMPGAFVVAILYLGMLVARTAIPPGRARLVVLAALMLAIAGAALIFTFSKAAATAG